MHIHSQPGTAMRQRGLTLIEFMISIVLGMILVAAIAVLIANQSTARNEIDRGGRLIENGRYAMQVISDDLLMAGYYGESTSAPTGVTITAMPDPCSATVASGNAASPGIQEASTLYIQGYDNSNYTAATLSCVTYWKSGTDIVVVRHADPDTSAVLTGGNTDLSKLTAGQPYLQTGLTSSTATAFNYKFYAGDSAANSTNFTLVNKSNKLQAPRKWHVHIYYIASCSVCTGGSADTIPTLKRVELTTASGAATMNNIVTIAEGVENMQIDYGVDTDGDGSPEGTDIVASNASLGTSPTNWQNVVSTRVYLLVRSSESVAGYTNTKKFAMGASFPASAPLDPGADAYQRHLFSQAIRLVNPSSRRSS
jgi:type IV pilus assembly protein PilW